MKFKTVRLVLGDQLNIEHSWFRQVNDDVIYIIAELKQETDYVASHIQKVATFFCAMGYFADGLKEQGHQVLHLTLDDTTQFENLDTLLKHYVHEFGAEKFEYQRPDEYRLLDNRQRELVTQESYPQLEQLIYDKASRRGLPVVVPLLDLQDRRLVGVPEVWGNFSEPVEEASKRYSAERSITARMYQEFNSDNWVLDWRFTNDEMFESNRIIGYRQQIVAQMIDDLAQGLAGEYAIDPNAYYEQRTANLTLKGTDNFVDIELAKRRLLNLSVVTQAVIIRKTPDSVEFKLDHTGTVNDLKKALGLDNAFKDYVDPRAFYHIVDKQSLEYQWVEN